MSISKTITANTARLIAGVEYACEGHNATLPEGETPLTPTQYMDRVFSGAVEDWANQAERAAKMAAAGL